MTPEETEQRIKRLERALRLIAIVGMMYGAAIMLLALRR